MGTTGFAERVRKISTARSMDIAEKARSLAGAGADIIDFSWGEPDFDTPEAVREACKQALDRGLTHYSASRGIEALRAAVCAQAKREQGLEYSPKTDVIITPGAKQAIFYALFALLDRGDEVLAPEPYWLSYKDSAELAGGRFVTAVCGPENGFRVRPRDLEQRITARTKVLLLNNPCNPTGVLLGSDELAAIADIVRKTGITVLSDEIYSGLVFDGRPFTSFAALPGMRERTITINGFSKTYAMTGWRLGYILAGSGYIDAINRIHQHIATCAGTFTQYAAEEALRSCAGDVRQMRDEYESRRDLMVRLAGSVRNISCLKPDATFYLWLDIRKTGYSSADFADLLLDRAGIASVPGDAYGASGEGYIRFAFTKPKERIREGMDRIRRMLA